MLGLFLSACTSGDLEGLKAILADDVVAVTDGGGKARAARNAIHGADDVARLFIGIARKGETGVLDGALGEVNGELAFVARRDGVPVVVAQLVVDGERVSRVLVIVNPDKLTHVG